uniref:C-type lectin domain-containing protein n=1 Tax=Sinocyclocheilus grahami TaxID=75366 RepID=A0A672LRA8_SINGR
SMSHCFLQGFSQCEEGWRSYDERCYFFSSDMKSWHDALEDCVSKASNLMSIQDIHERTWVRTQISSSIFWIGLNDVASEGNWEWSDGTDFQPWETNQPDNWQNNEDCVHIRGTEHQDTGKLNDLPCSSTYPFICQKGGNNLRCSCLISLLIVLLIAHNDQSIVLVSYTG